MIPPAALSAFVEGMITFPTGLKVKSAVDATVPQVMVFPAALIFPVGFKVKSEGDVIPTQLRFFVLSIVMELATLLLVKLSQRSVFPDGTITIPVGFKLKSDGAVIVGVDTRAQLRFFVLGIVMVVPLLVKVSQLRDVTATVPQLSVFEEGM